MDLNDTERAALALTSEALEIIRKLASSPMTPGNHQAIVDLADALHNVPAHAAGDAHARTRTAFLMEGALDQARAAYRRHGLRSLHIDTGDIDHAQRSSAPLLPA